MTFRSIYHQGFARVAAGTTRCAVGDRRPMPRRCSRWRARCHDEAVALVVFPELALSGYAIDDLLLQDPLLDAVERALVDMIAGSAELRPLMLIGAPLRFGARIYNCAAVVQRGRLLGVVPKIHLPNYREFYERRQLASGEDAAGSVIQIGRWRAPFGPDLLFAADDVPGLVVHAEICEDVWVPMPPSSVAALAGATVLANLSASNITIGKADTRRRCVPVAVGALPGGLSLHLGGHRRVDHRPGVGRPGLDLRERRRAGRDRQVSRGRPIVRRRRRSRPAAPGARPHGHVRRQPPGPCGGGRALSPA